MVMTEKELISELREIVTWTQINKDKVLRLYKVYHHIFKTKGSCTKCPSVIRNNFKKVKDYYYKNYEKYEI